MYEFKYVLSQNRLGVASSTFFMFSKLASPCKNIPLFEYFVVNIFVILKHTSSGIFQAKHYIAKSFIISKEKHDLIFSFPISVPRARTTKIK